MRKAIVVVDMQNDFIDGALGTREAQEMLPRMVEKLTAARAEGTARTTSVRRRGSGCPSSTASAPQRGGRSPPRYSPSSARLQR